jgi:osmotically-inducible protein OsmY
MQPDRDLELRVQEALRQDSRIPPDTVSATVEHGVVTLNGQVSTFDAYEAAEETALRTAGVLDIANEMEISAQHGLTDAHIAEAVRTSLKSCMHADSERVQCSVSHGVVTLRGAAESWRDVADAEQAAAEVCGVQEVVDEILVEPTAQATSDNSFGRTNR